MTTSYDILVSVALKHGYFAASMPEYIGIQPSQNCRHILNRNGFLVKPMRGGFTVLYDALLAGRTRTRQQAIAEDMVLRFYMTLNDSHFYNYTSGVTHNLATDIFYFHNRQTPATDYLHAGTAVSGTELIPVVDIDERFFIKPFGILDITVSAELKMAYTIQFNEMATYWRYHLVSEHLKKLSNPAIIRGDDLFDGPVTTVLPDAREAITFVSRTPIPLSGYAAGINQLVENFEAGGLKHKIIMRALPTPDVKNISVVGGAAKKDQHSYSEIFI